MITTSPGPAHGVTAAGAPLRAGPALLPHPFRPPPHAGQSETRAPEAAVGGEAVRGESGRWARSWQQGPRAALPLPAEPAAQSGGPGGAAAPTGGRRGRGTQPREIRAGVRGERRLPERPYAAFRCPEPAGGSRCPQRRGGPGRSRCLPGGHLRCLSRRCHASLCIFTLTLGPSYRYFRKRAGILHSASWGRVPRGPC